MKPKQTQDTLSPAILLRTESLASLEPAGNTTTAGEDPKGDCGKETEGFIQIGDDHWINPSSKVK